MKSKYSKARDVEAEANAFALCILIPGDMLKDEVDKIGGLDLTSDADFKMLCDKFQVSQTAMMVRMSMMNLCSQSKINTLDYDALVMQLRSLDLSSENSSEQKK